MAELSFVYLHKLIGEKEKASAGPTPRMANPYGVLNIRPYPVVGPQYCVPYPANLAVVRKALNITNGKFSVTDISGNVLFKVNAALLSLRDRRVLVDAAGNPVVTLQRKLATAHDRWQAYSGESTDDSDLIFTVKRSWVLQVKAKLHVFLATNRREEICDYMVKGSWLQRSCTVYAGDSTTVVAQMHKKFTAKDMLMGKDNFMVTIHANIDNAFIVALIVILDEVDRSMKKVVKKSISLGLYI